MKSKPLQLLLFIFLIHLKGNQKKRRGWEGEIIIICYYGLNQRKKTFLIYLFGGGGERSNKHIMWGWGAWKIREIPGEMYQSFKWPYENIWCCVHIL